MLYLLFLKLADIYSPIYYFKSDIDILFNDYLISSLIDYFILLVEPPIDSLIDSFITFDSPIMDYLIADS